MHKLGGVAGGGVGERQMEKQALSAMQDSVPGTWGHDLTRRQMLS